MAGEKAGAGEGKPRARRARSSRRQGEVTRLSPQEINRIEKILEENPEAAKTVIARELDRPRATFDLALARSGKRIVHRLEDIEPVAPAPSVSEAVAA